MCELKLKLEVYLFCRLFIYFIAVFHENDY